MIFDILDNGLRVVADKAPGAVSYIGVAVDAGAAADPQDLPGVAHFVEHTIFKGTDRHTSRQVSARLESIGGELNAYTSKEETVIYTNAPRGYSARALGLLAELVSAPAFPTEEVERERDVIIEEIHSYADSPADAVYDNFDDMLYAGTALGHNILGTVESVRKIGAEDARRFVRRNYRPDNMVLYIRDPEPERAVAQARRAFASAFAEAKAPGAAEAAAQNYLVPAVPSPFAVTDSRFGSSQANTVAGCRVFGRRDPRRHAIFMLNNYLGGPAMGSRLNRELREKRGLVYTVDSTVALYRDTGAWQVYFGSEPGQVGRCMRIIEREIAKLAETRISDKRFEQLKQQYCGQLMVSSDHIEHNAMSMAKSMLYYGEVHGIEYTVEKIRALRAEDVREAAELLAGGLSRLTLV